MPIETSSGRLRLIYLMTPEYTNQLAIELLLSSFVCVLAISLFAGFMVLIYTRQSRARSIPEPMPSGEPNLETHYTPSVFEQSCRWLAVKNAQLPVVQAALDLHNPVPCSWGEGVSRLGPGRLFLSPPIHGWILVIGNGLPDPTDDVDRCFHFLVRLSRSLGQVQFFSMDRAVNHHAWVRADGGRIRRAYAWAGETLWNQGAVTPAESELCLKCFAYGEGSGMASMASDEASVPNADRLIALAARWSLDPTSISEGTVHAALGVTGELANSQRR